MDNIYGCHYAIYLMKNIFGRCLLFGREFIYPKMLQESTCQLFEHNGFGKNIVHVLVNGGLRNNYGQTCDVNGFVGESSSLYALHFTVKEKYPICRRKLSIQAISKYAFFFSLCFTLN